MILSEEKYNNGSRRGPKSSVTVLTKTKSKLLLHFSDAVGISLSEYRMKQCWKNNEKERVRMEATHGLIWDIISTFAWRDWEKTRNFRVRIVSSSSVTTLVNSFSVKRNTLYPMIQIQKFAHFNQVGWCCGHVLDFHPGGARFASRQGHGLFWLNFPVFLSRPGKLRDSTPLRLLPLPSKSFLINQPSI